MNKFKTNYLYRIVSAADFALFRQNGVVPLNDFDRRSGFVHLSMLHQVEKSLQLHFRQADQPCVLVIDKIKLGEKLKWEKVATRGDAYFPHLYGTLSRQDVVDIEEVRWENGLPYLYK